MIYYSKLLCLNSFTEIMSTNRVIDVNQASHNMNIQKGTIVCHSLGKQISTDYEVREGACHTALPFIWSSKCSFPLSCAKMPSLPYFSKSPLSKILITAVKTSHFENISMRGFLTPHLSWGAVPFYL